MVVSDDLRRIVVGCVSMAAMIVVGYAVTRALPDWELTARGIVADTRRKLQLESEVARLEHETIIEAEFAKWEAAHNNGN